MQFELHPLPFSLLCVTLICFNMWHWKVHQLLWHSVLKSEKHFFQKNHKLRRAQITYDSLGHPYDTFKVHGKQKTTIGSMVIFLQFYTMAPTYFLDSVDFQMTSTLHNKLLWLRYVMRDFGERCYYLPILFQIYFLWIIQIGSSHIEYVCTYH